MRTIMISLTVAFAFTFSNIATAQDVKKVCKKNNTECTAKCNKVEKSGCTIAATNSKKCDIKCKEQCKKAGKRCCNNVAISAKKGDVKCKVQCKKEGKSCCTKQ